MDDEEQEEFANKVEYVEEKHSLLVNSDSNHSESINDYEVALKSIGFGLFHVLLFLAMTFAVTADTIEIVSISFVLQYLRLPTEFAMTGWQSGLVSAILLVGMLIGGYTLGSLADITGRRPILVLSLTINSIFAMLSSFSPDYYSFVVFRFISGIGVGGSIPVTSTYISEFVQSSYRGTYLGAFGSAWVLGAYMCGGVAWVLLPSQYSFQLGTVSVHSWRIFLFICGVPSLIGALLCFFLPESPRYLLEINEEERALNGLKIVHKLNNMFNKKPFPIESIKIKKFVESNSKSNSIKKCGWIYDLPKNFIEMLKRTSKLFHKSLLRSTLLLMIAFYCISFGSYGLTLWFPSYIDHLLKQNLVNKNCNQSLHDVLLTSQYNTDQFLCECSQTDYSNVTFNVQHVEIWKSLNATVNDSIIMDGNYDWVWLEGVSWHDVEVYNVSFNNLIVLNSTLQSVVLSDVSFNNTIFCGVQFNDTIVNNQTIENCTNNLTSIHCSNANTVDYNKEYIQNFIVYSGSIVGSIISAVAVYFIIRSFCLAISLGMCAFTALMLYFVHNEFGSVAILFAFNLFSRITWNVVILIVVDVYPTALRSTAAGFNVMPTRIGAIMGTYIFGAFPLSSITFPVLLTAAILSVGTLASLFLPWTTRKTTLY